MDLGKYGPWALIVGGSEGVGAGFARKLAADGFNVALVARKPEPLAALADEIRGSFGVQVRSVSVDMTAADALDQVRKITDDVEVGLLVYNAGANSVRGDFVNLPAEVTRAVIAVNVLGPAEFVRHYGHLMCERRKGGIITTGSSAGYVGTKTLAAYCGSKAFSRIFSEAVWVECAEFGVDVLHLNIGFTATPAMERLGYDLRTAQSPDEVAQEGIDNIANGPVWIVGGQGNVDRAEQHSPATGRAAIVRAQTSPPRK